MAELVTIEGQQYKKRDPLGVLGLSFITIGIYWLYWYYTINDEIRRSEKDDSVRPGIALLAVTLGWFIIVPPFISVYNTSKHIVRMEERSRGHAGAVAGPERGPADRRRDRGRPVLAGASEQGLGRGSGASVSRRRRPERCRRLPHDGRFEHDRRPRAREPSVVGRGCRRVGGARPRRLGAGTSRRGVSGTSPSPSWVCSRTCGGGTPSSSGAARATSPRGSRVAAPARSDWTTPAGSSPPRGGSRTSSGSGSR